jgi:hypothetical protein
MIINVNLTATVCFVPVTFTPIVLLSSTFFCDVRTLLYSCLLGVYLSWVKTNETYIWFLFIMSMYIHVAETLIAAALCHRSDHKAF